MVAAHALTWLLEDSWPMGRMESKYACFSSMRDRGRCSLQPATQQRAGRVAPRPMQTCMLAVP
jgi:hypothetical protein